LTEGERGVGLEDEKGSIIAKRWEEEDGEVRAEHPKLFNGFYNHKD